MASADKRGSRAPRTLTRRGFLQAAVGTTGLLLLSACGGATQAPAPKPTEAPKPAAPVAPTSPPKPAEAAKPAAPAATTAPAAKAPVSLKGVSLSVLQWSSFIKDADPFFQKQIEDGFMKDTGATVTIEFIDANQIQPKTAAAIQSGSGPDVIGFRDNWTYLYKDGVVDVSDVAEELKKQWGDFFPAIEAYSKVDGKYLTMPHDFGGGVIHWRKSWFKEVGSEAFPKTYEEYHDVGKKLKAKGRPFGQALGHSFGDPPGWCYSMLWAYGGREVDEQGKVAINSPETIAAVKAMQTAWKDAYDETGLSWDDTSNNRAFLAETISSTLNGASIWWAAKNDKQPFFDDIGLNLHPAGPKGIALLPGFDSYSVMKYSKNIDAAKEFLRWSMKPEVWGPWFQLQQSYVGGITQKFDDGMGWDKFPPIVQVFREIGKNARTVGWPGPPNQKASLAWSKYIIVDMFAKGAQGDPPESAAKWAEGELKQVYEM
ncbi:MAG TPA: extracellular solute-binding protein [Chloroflexota bacterium]|nr:extracellular solute-binding protein [Chloroflexota bacterium]